MSTDLTAYQLNHLGVLLRDATDFEDLKRRASEGPETQEGHELRAPVRAYLDEFDSFEQVQAEAERKAATFGGWDALFDYIDDMESYASYAPDAPTAHPSPATPPPPGGDRRLLSAWTPALGVLIGTYITVQTKIEAQDMGTAILDPMALGLAFAIAVVLVSLPIWAVWKFLLNRPRPDGIAQPIAAILVGVGYWDIRVGNGELFALWGPWSQLILTVLGLGIMVAGAGLVVFSFWRRMTGRCGDDRCD